MSKILKKGSETQKLRYLGNPEVTWLGKVRKLNHERGKMGWLKKKLTSVVFELRLLY